MKKVTVILLAGIGCCVQLMAQLKKITYKESQEDFANPERGFYIPSGTKASNFVLLDAKQLQDYRQQPQQPGSASYKMNMSLLYRSYELDTFKYQPLSEIFLSNLQKDFDAVRQSGLKIILRLLIPIKPPVAIVKMNIKYAPLMEMHQDILC